MGYPSGGGEATCLDSGDGPRIEAEFKKLRSGESAQPKGIARVELWTRLKGRVKRHTYPEVPKATKAAKKAAKVADGDDEDI